MSGKKRELMQSFSPMRSTRSMIRKHGLRETGLTPVYPVEADCPIVTSPFASRTRTDGSFRSDNFYNGYHGGMDIPTAEGTPILAMADGEVIAIGEGNMIGGIYIILRHTPEDTGLTDWTFTQYKHLKEVPAISRGTRVRMGTPIGLTGKTGTDGPNSYYGIQGFVHLHLDAFVSPDDEFVVGRIKAPKNGQWIDPLALLRGGDVHTDVVRKLAKNEKQVQIAYMSADRKPHPANSRVVYPYVCGPK